MSILFVRPADDSTAQLMSNWGQSIRSLATSIPTRDLANGQVSRSAIDKEKYKYEHIFWFGHGEAYSLVSSGINMIDSKNFHDLNGGITVAIACHAAVGLGQNAGLNKGCIAFLGFDDEFTIPAKAPMPMQFALRRGLECLFTANHEIGCAAQQVLEQFRVLRDDYKQNGSAYGLSAGETRLAWMCAKNNQYSLQLIGDSTAKLK